jgi:putative aldouronate transport system substrate-binding protein
MKKMVSLLLALAMAFTLLVPALAEDRVTWPEEKEPVELTLFADCTWLDYDSFDGIVPQWIQDATGIKLNLIKATDSNQLALLIAGGELPDLIMTDSSTMFYELSHDDMCYPFDELIAQYVPNWSVPEVEQKLNAYYSEDGRYYMLKNYFNTVEDIKSATKVAPNNDQFHVRGDIYEALGRPDATSEESFMNLLETVKEQYPDMVPMVFMPRNYGAFASLVGLDRSMPTDENGNYVYEMSDPHFRDFLRVINDCYRAGYIMAENFSFNSDEQQQQYIADGSAFMITGYGVNDEQNFTTMVQSTNPDAWFEQMPLMDNYARTFSVTGWAGCFISKNCADPEAAIKLIAWLKDGDNQISAGCGPEGEYWYYDENGEFHFTDKYDQAIAADAYAMTDVGFLLSASTFLSEGVISYTKATAATRALYDETRDRANWSNVLGMCSPAGTSDEGSSRPS